MEDMRGVDHETARQDRKRKLEVRIQELSREVENAKQISEMFDEQVVREVDDFERIKVAEFRDTLGAFATSNAAFYSNVIDAWERFMADLEAEGPQPVKDKGKATGS